MHPNADILVVDDTAANLTLLSSILKDAGYKVRAVPSGALALAAVRQRAPDLVLLDINMPEMDGYQVCEALKGEPALADLPVIFLSALTGTEDKVRAFQVGGVDYITKPFHHEEVCARVATHLRLRSLQRDLEKTIDELRRADELQESLVHMIVHDLRSPLTGIMSSLQIMEMSRAPEDSQDLEDLGRAIGSVRAMSRMIDTLLDLAKMEAGELRLDAKNVALSDIVAEAVRVLGRLLSEHVIETRADAGAVEVWGDASLLTRTVENLLGNAVKFTPAGGKIVVRTSSDGKHGRLEVSDTGIGVPKEFHTKIFEKFGQVEARHSRARSSTGLGLAFCKLVADAHGGTIGVESDLGRGSTFWMELPLAKP
jgi:two-component system sensor histidine kinase/response regulator